MQKDDKDKAPPKLDRSKLLGFRNLEPVMRPDSDVRESSDLAFTKRGEGGQC